MCEGHSIKLFRSYIIFFAVFAAWQAFTGGNDSTSATTVLAQEQQVRSTRNSRADTVSVLDYPGADRTGVVNSAPAIQAAANAACALGAEIVLLPAGRYKIASTIAPTCAVHFLGDKWSENSRASGTWLEISGTDFTPFFVTGLRTRGMLFENIAIGEQQPDLGGPTWSPLPYPYVWDIEDTLGEVQFRNILLYGITRGIKCVNSGRLNIDGLYGQVYVNGVYIDKGYDVIRVNNIHFWPYTSSDRRIVAWEVANSDGIISLRNDNPIFHNIVVVGMRSAFVFGVSASGKTSKFQIESLDADLSKYALWITANGTTGIAADVLHQGDHPNGGFIAGSDLAYIDASNCNIILSGMRSDLEDRSAVDIRGSGNIVLVQGAFVTDWDRGNAGIPAFAVSDGGVSSPNVLTALAVSFKSSSAKANLFSPAGVGAIILQSSINYSNLAAKTNGMSLSSGSLGIGTVVPQATLDVNGYARLKVNMFQPAACSEVNNGAIALTSRSTLCTCRSTSLSWVETSDGTTACKW